jgi:hypothetical protein
MEIELVHKKQIQKYHYSKDKPKRIFVLAAFVLAFGIRKSLHQAILSTSMA